MVGMPTPNPTAKAMMSPVSRPEPEPEPEPGLMVALLLLLLLLPLLLLLLPPPDAPVCVGVEPVADDELALPVLSEDPVATAASPDTTAVVVLLGCGLFAAGWHENMTDFPS